VVPLVEDVEVVGPPDVVTEVVGPPDVVTEVVGPPDVVTDVVGPPDVVTDVVGPADVDTPLDPVDPDWTTFTSEPSLMLMLIIISSRFEANFFKESSRTNCAFE
jgi:hypothetical protein